MEKTNIRNKIDHHKNILSEHSNEKAHSLSWSSQKPPWFFMHLWIDICVGHISEGKGEREDRKEGEERCPHVSSSSQFGQLGIHLQDPTFSIISLKIKAWTI